MMIRLYGTQLSWADDAIQCEATMSPLYRLADFLFGLFVLLVNGDCFSLNLERQDVCGSDSKSATSVNNVDCGDGLSSHSIVSV